MKQLAVQLLSNLELPMKLIISNKPNSISPTQKTELYIGQVF